MAFRVLILVEGVGQIDACLSLVQGNSEAQPLLLALNRGTARELESRNIDYKTAADYGVTDEYLNDESIKWFREFPDAKAVNKNIKESILYRGMPVWWLVDEMIYMSRFAFPSVREISKNVIMLERIITAEKPSAVYCESGDSALCAAVGAVCEANGVAAYASLRSAGIRKRLYHSLRAFAYIYGQWLRILTRKICWTLSIKNNRQEAEAGGKKFLVFSGANWDWVYDLENGGMKKGEPYFSPVIDLLLAEKNSVLSVDVPIAFTWGLKVMREKKRQRQMLYRPLESCLTIGAVIRAYKEAGRVSREYRLLAEPEDFRQSMKIGGIPLYGLIRRNLSLFFSRQYLTLALAVFEMARRMIKTEQPDAIMLCGEFMPHERAIEWCAKAKNVPVLLLQHGLYSPYFIHYNHEEADISPDRQNKAPYCPVPDILAMSDSYTKDILVERGKFRSEDVIVTGQPRYDVMAQKYDILSREKVFEKHKLDPQKKLVAWMTATGAFTLSENRRYINSVYSAVNALKDTQLLVKTHPGENQKAPLYRENDLIKPAIADKYGLHTIELLNAADAVIINGWCSTGIEAIMLGKPLISMEFGSMYTPPYVDCGAAIAAGNEEEVMAALDNVLHNDNMKRQLEQGRWNFMENGGFINDGKAAQRVAALIKRMAEKH